MAKAVVNPEAVLAARPRDVEPTEALLAALGLFSSLKKSPAFAKFPGTCVLRHYRAGEVICRQGDAGGTAFYLLTAADIEALAQKVDEQGVAVLREDASGGGAVGELRALLQRLAAQRGGQAPFAPKTTQKEPVPVAPAQPRRLATARLLVDIERRPRASRRSWLQSLWPGRDKGPRAAARPATIANDGPADIDYNTRQAALYEGEVFGEMSCLMRQPRSATIVVDAECLVLEFLRNILEQMRKDPTYNKEAEAKYRERVLENHLRQLPLFESLSEKDFRVVRECVELVRLAPGSVIWDEGDESDAVYVVRSGVVQVLQSFPWRLSEQAITDWPKFIAALNAAADVSPIAARVKTALPKDVQTELGAVTGEPSAEFKQKLITALNELSKADTLLSAKELQTVLTDPRMVRETATFAGKPKAWTGMQLRRANRVLYQMLFPQSVAAAEPVGRARVMQYLGRGSILGEIGVVRKKPRTASCVAYAHPRTDADATEVELVRVPAEVIHKIQTTSKQLRSEFEKLIASREKRSAVRSKAPVEASAESRRAEELGLLQGQNLMLIDLDRCTRCGDCVQACIDTHDDGHSRLYLDGPRFGKYLIPSSCRQCRDPVCMIGCPVGSIQQGDDGEIVIREWCIGCGLCANQCPYDSIQMHDEALLPSGAPGWLWCDGASDSAAENWHTPGCKEGNWRVGSAPFQWGIDMVRAVMASAPISESSEAPQLYFRAHFSVDSANRETAKKYRLLITSQGTSLEARINGQPLELTQDAAQKKRYQHVADISGEKLRPGDNVLAIAVAAPGEFNAVVLDARLDTLAAESEEVEVKLVTERAVVCDQCSSLSGERHACVYACPHEAALRVDSWDFLAGQMSR